MKTRDKRLVALGQNVRKLRKLHKLSQESLAEKCGVHRTYLSDIERGARNLSLSVVLRIAAVFGISVAKLVSGIDSPSEKAVEP